MISKFDFRIHIRFRFSISEGGGYPKYSGRFRFGFRNPISIFVFWFTPPHKLVWIMLFYNIVCSCINISYTLYITQYIFILFYIMYINTFSQTTFYISPTFFIANFMLFYTFFLAIPCNIYIFYPHDLCKTPHENTIYFWYQLHQNTFCSINIFTVSNATLSIYIFKLLRLKYQ